MNWFSSLFGAVTLVIPIVIAVVLAIFAWWAVIATATRVEIGLVAVGLAYLIQTAFVAAPTFSLGINVSTDDLAFSLLLASLIVKQLFFKSSRANAIFWAWFSIGAVLLFSLALGLLQYGSVAGVEVRPNFYFWVAGLYFSGFTYTTEQLRKIWQLSQWCAWCISAIVIFRWIGIKIGFVSASFVEMAGASSEFRVVGSGPTFVLGAIGVSYFSHWLRDARRNILCGALVMLGLVLVLQHRSVWVATLGALAVVIWHQRKSVTVRAFPIVATGAVVVAAIALFLVVDPSSRLTETLSKSVTSVTESRGTHTDRMDGWAVLLTDYSTTKPYQWLIGTPYGTGYRRIVLGRVQEFSPHNFYVQLLLRIGAVGLLLFLGVHIALRRRVLLWRTLEKNDPTLRTILLATLAANLLYFIPYQGFYMQGAFYGVLISILSANSSDLLGTSCNTSSNPKGLA